MSSRGFGRSWFARLAPLVFLLVFSLAPGTAHATKVTISFSGLTGSATAQLAADLSGTRQWTVASTDNLSQRTKNLSQGNTLVFTASVQGGAAFVVSAASATGGTISSQQFTTTNHTNIAYHSTYVFNYTIPTADSTVTVTFVPRYIVKSTVTTGSTTGGLLLSDGTSMVGTTYWGQNETATVTATAATNYGLETFAFGTDAKSVTGYPTTQAFTSAPITKNMDDSTGAPGIKAGFVRIYTITPVTDLGGVTGSGGIDPSVPQRVKAGTSATFTVNAAAGSKILKLDVDGSTVQTEPASPYAYTFSAVNADHVIKAWFNTPAVNIRNYCVTPSFLTATLKPNLLLMLDNSASMYDLAYNNTNATTYCYDNSYNNSFGYYGNFTADQGYSYNFTTQQFDLGSASKPASCTYSTSYFCLNTNSSGAVTSFWGTGRFLNWLSASKLDQQKRILTGGKYDTTSKVLVSESRGCVGRRFVKDIPTSDWIDQASGVLTFGVRGPNSYDVDYVNQSTQGGKTRIEIFKGNYDATHCNGAVTDWSNPSSIGDVQLGGSGSNTSLCLGSTGNLKTSAYNHIIHLCYRSLTGGLAGNGEINSLESDCQSAYATYYNNDPSAITNENAGDAVCASTLWHPLLDGDEVGYIGQCWSRTQDPLTLAYTTSWNDTCVTREIGHFCTGAHAFDVTDPSDAALIAASGSSAGSITPSFIMDAGLAALGTPVATMLAHVSQPTTPLGLINEFSDVIGFGTMEYNINGVGSGECDSTDPKSLVKCAKACKVDAVTYASPYRECYADADCPSGTTCGAVAPRDGARIRAYIGDPLGDHATAGSVIKSIDDLTAGTWTPLAEAFYNAIGYYAHRSDMRLNNSDLYDFDMAASKNPSTYTCRDNYVLILSDGESTVDANSSVNTLATSNPGPFNSAGLCDTAGTYGYHGSKNLDDLVYLARKKNITKSDFSDPARYKNDHILTYVINTGKPTAATATDECLSPGLLLDHASLNGVDNGTTAPVASDAGTLATTMREVFSKVASRITSGTAASILSNSEGSGANLLQAIFYPVKTFDQLNTKVSWIGELQDFWYYIDPFIANSSVREDSDWNGTDRNRTMNLTTDYVAQFVFNDQTAQTEVRLWQDTNGDGIGDAAPPQTSRFISMNPPTVSADDVMSLFRAGQNLWKKDPAQRNIYTQQNGSLVNFSGSALGTSQESVYRYLFQTSSEAEANDIISYVRGTDNLKFRSRSLKIPNQNGDNASIWKLGDIISSTPRVQSSNKLNNYHLPPPIGYKDTSYEKFATSNDYLNRGMAYVGANDGMLHAFKSGKLVTATNGMQRATLLSGDQGVLGNEEWAFIPRNAIPYLTYLTDPGYPHLYYVDGTPALADVSINSCAGSSNYWDCPKDYAAGSNWRTVIIAGMGLGGASKDFGTTSDVTNSVKTPLTGVGYSSYFALDITNQTFDPVHGTRNAAAQQPALLWEFAHQQLGYAVSGPAIVRIAATTNGRADNTKNGRWFAVFASGPTGPIDLDACQFKGKSDQNLRLFVVDLNATGAWTAGTNYWILDTGIPFAFGGSITGGVTDADRSATSPGYYQDDAVYVGYTRNSAADGTGTWTQGGVVRLLTHENLDPANWTVAKVIDGIGAVTSNISKLQDLKNHNYWLYFGTGRYFYNQDDMSSGRKLFGIKEPCYTAQDTIRKDCADADQVNRLLLTDQSDSPHDTLSTGLDKGWFISLDAEDTANNRGAERAVTDAVAMSNGAVFFTTYKPTGDPCQYGGRSRMWAVKYDTGFQAPDAALKGKALVQISTGEFKELDLRNIFTARYNRAMADEMTGKPPADPPPIVSNSYLKPVKKILHIQEH